MKDNDVIGIMFFLSYIASRVSGGFAAVVFGLTAMTYLIAGIIGLVGDGIEWRERRKRTKG